MKIAELIEKLKTFDQGYMPYINDGEDCHPVEEWEFEENSKMNILFIRVNRGLD